MLLADFTPAANPHSFPRASSAQRVNDGCSSALRFALTRKRRAIEQLRSGIEKLTLELA